MSKYFIPSNFLHICFKLKYALLHLFVSHTVAFINVFRYLSTTNNWYMTTSLIQPITIMTKMRN